MKKILALLLLLNAYSGFSQFNYQRSWGTYFGDERFTLMKSQVDRQGNLYLVGSFHGENNEDFPDFTTGALHQSTYGGGAYDGFIVKFAPSGTILWGTYFGGAGDDAIGGIDVDVNNNIYIVGRTNSSTGIATANAFQPAYAGEGDYFLARFTEDGQLVWGSYFGTASADFALNNVIGLDNDRMHLAFDGSSNIYISDVAFGQTLATDGVFQQNLQNSNYHISKFNLDGNRIFTTFYGLNTHISALKADISGVYVMGRTHDLPPFGSYNTYYGTSGAHQSAPGNHLDIFISKFTNAGHREWSTYYGGSSSELAGRRALALANDKVFISGSASNYSNQQIATSGAHQSNTSGTSNFIAQFNSDGSRIMGTYNGNVNPATPSNASAYPSNVSSHTDGTFYNFGQTRLIDIATPGSYMPNLASATHQNGFICKFDSSGVKIWGTYYGGEGYEANIDFQPFVNNFYILGETTSNTGIATENAYQSVKNAYDTSIYIPGMSNIFIAHFEPLPLATRENSITDFKLFPNPSSGTFTIFLVNDPSDEASLELYDVSGRRMHQQRLNTQQSLIQITGLSSGIYTCKVFLGNQQTSRKIIIN